MKRGIFLAGLLLVSSAWADQRYTVQRASSLSYKLVHKLHVVEGSSKQVEGKAVVSTKGRVVVQLRAPVQSFESGNGNRDAHMKEVLEAAKFPNVEVKAASADGAVTKTSGSFQVPLKGKLIFHGVEKPFEATFTVTFADPTHATVAGEFPVSLDAHGVERPSLLMVKVDDQVKIEPRLVLEADK